jgi:pimeloyl-ACP methyl ester carboxylesterase
MRAAVVLAALVAATASAPATATTAGTVGTLYLRPTAMIDVGDGATLAMYCAGNGSPTVLMDAGLGDAAYQWATVQPQIARTTRVCTYDRAGYMFSRGLPLPRTSDRIVAELHALVMRAHLATPLVIVGHSFGSYNVRLFADRYRSLVAGMVLVDGSHERQNELFPRSMPALIATWSRHNDACRTAARHGIVPTDPYCLPDPDPRFAPALQRIARRMYARPSSFDTILAEERSFNRSAAEVRAARRSFGDLPMVVVSAGRPGRFGAPGVSAADVTRAEATWSRLQADLATLSRRGEHVTVANSGHYVQKDAPWVVIAAVQHVVEEVRMAEHR